MYDYVQTSCAIKLLWRLRRPSTLKGFSIISMTLRIYTLLCKYYFRKKFLTAYGSFESLARNLIALGVGARCHNIAGLEFLICRVYKLQRSSRAEVAFDKSAKNFLANRDAPCERAARYHLLLVDSCAPCLAPATAELDINICFCWHSNHNVTKLCLCSDYIRALILNQFLLVHLCVDATLKMWKTCAPVARLQSYRAETL